MVGTIILFIKEMCGNKNKSFAWSGAFSVVGRGCLTNYLFLFGLSNVYPPVEISNLKNVFKFVNQILSSFLITPFYKCISE